MPVEPGTRLLHYTLSEKIGEGGMGAVWRATDTTLHREVAIKLLPQVFADDGDRLARFEREAKLLASLNHPNIAGIYGLHAATIDGETVRFLAMEYVEGEDLSRRLQSGALPVDTALEIAAQMCAGIEAAHDSGVVHRDLKPANVIVAPDGRVRVLDFGLAKAFENDPASGNPSLSPTVTSAGTVAGMILGTAAYMSPEQARGKPVDRRADLWSFGCVLYEMLTGVGLFAGETISDSLAAILRKDPDWDRLPAETPPMIRLLLRRCLERDPARRLRDAGDARLEIEQAIRDPRPEALGLAAAAGAAAPASRSFLPWAIAAVALLALGVALVKGGGESTVPAVSRHLRIAMPGPTEFGQDPSAPAEISPDGRQVVFGALDENGRSSLWLRSIDSFTARRLAGTEDGYYPFWSPDGKHVGFFLNGGLRRLELASGRIQPIGATGSFFPRGGSWGRGGKVLFAPDSNSGIMLMSAEGGEPRQLTTPDPNVPDSSHRWPHFLPDGEHFLFLFWTNDVASQQDHAGVYVGSLSGDEPVRIVPEASSVRYAEPGYLFVVQDGNLLALPFDAGARKVTGEAHVLATGVVRSRSNGFAFFSASNEGTVVYARGEAEIPATLAWYDRQGDSTPTTLDSAPFTGVRLSPDATRAVATLPGVHGDNELWMLELDRGVRTRIVGGSSWNYADPAWSPDGKRVAYTSQEAGAGDLYVRNADGSGQTTAVLVDGIDKEIFDWSADGRYLMYGTLGTGSDKPDIRIYDLEDKTSIELVAGSRAYTHARFSPDGRHVVYVSPENDVSEVFAQAREGGARWQVSTSGGTRPHWSRDGKEIVYHDLDNNAVAVPVEQRADGLKLGVPETLFSIDGVAAADLSPEHDRFLIATIDRSGNEPLYVILDWTAGL